MTLQVTDLPEEDLLSHFQSSNAFIEDGLSKDGAVLVHCYRGRSRSATVIGKKYAFTKYPPPPQKKTLQKVYYFREIIFQKEIREIDFMNFQKSQYLPDRIPTHLKSLLLCSFSI